MNAAAFFRTDEVRRALERVSQAGSMPVSVHFVEGDHEGPSLAGAGKCEACKYVAGCPGGKAACRDSRMSGSRRALTRQHPVAYLCHMGFACVSAPILPESAPGFVLTLGPYCPAEAPQTLTLDAMRGLAALVDEERPFFPTPLTDIALVPSASVPVIAEWTAESLSELWERMRERSQEVEPAIEDAGMGIRRPSRKRRPKAPDHSPYRGAEIAAALASGNQTLARSLVKSALAEVESKGEVLAVRRARAIALAGATLEAAECANLDTLDSWEEFPAFVTALRQARSDSDLTSAAMSLLAIVLRGTARASTDGMLPELDRLIMARLPEAVRLAEVAQRLNRHPTAITHQLQRKFGLSFSQYVGRVRIDMAKELLRRTRLGVGDIAQRVGVADASNFSKLFRKFEGVSPQQYRSRYKGQR
ncbi:MAG: helix-turn-helix domain-containing protein [Candidatus Hydrogenedentes bacterium]|nr:helix-turn-helix domain-containing protein [Candidatus Hydrogenedentota bacterium]